MEYAQRNGIRAISEITNNPTLLNVAEKAFKERENDRRRKEGLDSRGDTEQGENINAIPSKKDSGTHVKNTEGESGNIGLGSTDKGTRNAEGQREVDKTQRTNTTRDPLVETTKAAFEQSKAEYLNALKEGKTGKELENAELHYKFSWITKM